MAKSASALTVSGGPLSREALDAILSDALAERLRDRLVDHVRQVATALTPWPVAVWAGRGPAGSSFWLGAVGCTLLASRHRRFVARRIPRRRAWCQ
jgi:hypothetical protein